MIVNSVCIAGALRLYYSIITDKSPDTPWEGFYLWTWESIEINLGIVCASAPCLKSLITRIVPRLFSSHPSTNFPSFSATDRGDRFMAGSGSGIGGRRDVAKGYVMTTVTGGAGASGGRSGRKHGGGARSESQDDLTAHPGERWGECVLVAKVDGHDMA
jgi:hypothetical protein